MPPRMPASSLQGVRTTWYYVPGPYETIQDIGSGQRVARVTAEVQGSWTVTIGDPAATIVVTRLPDGRPATARITNPKRNETAVFEPPLALVPSGNAVETAAVTLYRGLHPQAALEDEQPKRTGEAERRFLAVADDTWSLDGVAYPAQVMTHELVLSLSPAQVRQTYVSTAVGGLGIVKEEMVERVGVLGVRVSGREERSEVIEFRD